MDRGRADVYAAEASAFEGTDLESVRPVTEVRNLVTAVVADPWWPGPEARVEAMRADAESSCARRVGDVVEIRIAAPQATVATAAHELAHALAGVEAGHGPAYRRAMLDVIDVITNAHLGPRRGRLHVGQLAVAYDAMGLVVGERTWPAPTAGEPFAL